MGLFNEVKKCCPDCGAQCMVQIPQVILGFGDFDLDTKNNIFDLTYEQKIELSHYVNNTNFLCTECTRTFTIKVIVDKEQGNIVYI